MNKKIGLVIVALFLLVVTVHSALAVDLTDGLVSYWDGSYSSSTAYDVHGSNDGEASNTRVFGTDGKILKGFDFTKGNDGVLISNTINIAHTTLNAWVYHPE